MVAKEQHSPAAVAEALRRTRGIKAAAAQLLGCDRVTVHNYCKRYATVQQAVDQARETLIDVAEGKLVQRVDAGDWDAVRFVLVTIGKDRGYVMRQESTGKEGAPIEHALHVTATQELVASRIIELAPAVRDRLALSASGPDPGSSEEAAA